MVAGPENTSVDMRHVRSAGSMTKPASVVLNENDSVVEYSPPDYWADSRLPTWLQALLTNVFVFVFVYFTVWGAPFILWLLWLAWSGRLVTAAVIVALYLPLYLNGKHRTAEGSHWNALRRLRVWNLISANYLRMTIVREAPLDATGNRKYVFGFHPHGIIVISRNALFGGNWEELFPNLPFRLLAASLMFTIPLGREFLLWLGTVDAGRKTAEKVLQSGKSIAVYPGGVPEMFINEATSKQNVVVLKSRTGFIKLAMRNGAALVPVVAFNEKWLFSFWQPRKSVRDFVRRTFLVPLVAFWGRFLWMPRAMPAGKCFGVVFGKPLEVPHTAEPTDEQVSEAQARYMAEIERLFAQYKVQFGCDPDETLVIR